MSRLTPPKLAQTSAIAGAIAWAIILFIRTSSSYETELIDKILLLGVLVIVPLGLSLVAMSDESGRHVLPYRLALIAQPFGAAAAVASFFLKQGRPAALLAVLWLIVTVLIALFGLWRLLFRGVLTANELCIGAGLIYLPVGGMWFARQWRGAPVISVCGGGHRHWYAYCGHRNYSLATCRVHRRDCHFARPDLSCDRRSRLGDSLSWIIAGAVPPGSFGHLERVGDGACLFVCVQSRGEDPGHRYPAHGHDARSHQRLWFRAVWLGCLVTRASRFGRWPLTSPSVRTGRNTSHGETRRELLFSRSV